MSQAPLTGPSRYADAEQIVERVASQGGTSLNIYHPPGRDQRQMLAHAARRFGLSVTNEGADLYYNVGAVLDGSTGFEHPMHYLTMWDDAIQFFGRTRSVYSPTLVVAGAGLWLEDDYQSRSDLWNDPRQRRFMPWRQLVRRINPKGLAQKSRVEAEKNLREKVYRWFCAEARARSRIVTMSEREVRAWAQKHGLE